MGITLFGDSYGPRPSPHQNPTYVGLTEAITTSWNSTALLNTETGVHKNTRKYVHLEDISLQQFFTTFATKHFFGKMSFDQMGFRPSEFRPNEFWQNEFRPTELSTKWVSTKCDSTKSMTPIASSRTSTFIDTLTGEGELAVGSLLGWPGWDVSCVFP